MGLSLSAEQKFVLEIFSGKNQYIIPPYQRAYSWTESQCMELIEDLKRAYEENVNEGYFLGNIIMLPFFQTSKSTFLIPPHYDTDCNSLSPLKPKLLM